MPTLFNTCVVHVQELVMSDEFTQTSRTYELAAWDKKWLAMDFYYKSTQDLEAYKPEAVKTRGERASELG